VRDSLSVDFQQHVALLKAKRLALSIEMRGGRDLQTRNTVDLRDAEVGVVDTKGEVLERVLVPVDDADISELFFERKRFNSSGYGGCIGRRGYFALDIPVEENTDFRIRHSGDDVEKFLVFKWRVFAVFLGKL